MKTVVIIGASHAAAEAINVLRQKKWPGRIVLIGDEAVLPYQRPPLSKAYYKGEMDEDKLLIRKASFYDDMNVDVFLGRRVELINREQMQVTLDTNETIGYDKLIIATGTRARQLQIPGAELPQVNYLRTKQDVDNIKSQLPKGAKLLIVGGGYIGLEVAASAVNQGIEVVVLEAMDRVLARVTSETVSTFYQNIHAEEGVDIRLNSSLQKFEGNADNIVAVLASGERIAFDYAIVGIGVLPNVELADACGLACDNGICVNEFTVSSDENIYAVGDCSNHPNFIYDRRIRLESVPNAVGQAKTAALSICGEPVAYNQLPWFWSDQYDVKLQTAGLLQGYDELVVRGDQTSRKFAVFYLKDKVLIAVDALNSAVEFMMAKKLIVAKACPDTAKLADPDIAMKTFLV